MLVIRYYSNFILTRRYQRIMQQNNCDKHNQTKISYTQYLIDKCYNEKQNKLELYRKKQSWVTVLSCQDWTFIKSLWIQKCQIVDIEVDVITQHQWINLQQLSLQTNDITFEGIKKLFALKFPNLKFFDIRENNIGDEGINYILKSQKIGRLLILYFDSNKITEKGLRDLSENTFEKLKWLSLQNNAIGCKGLKMLLKIKAYFLQKLWIGSCQIGDEGSKFLVKSDWPQLQMINIQADNFIGVEGIAGIILANWKQFQEILWFQIDPICLLGLSLTKWKDITDLSTWSDSEYLTHEIMQAISHLHDTQ